MGDGRHWIHNIPENGKYSHIRFELSQALARVRRVARAFDPAGIRRLDLTTSSNHTSGSRYLCFLRME